MTRNEAAERLRARAGHLMVTRPGRQASETVSEVLTQALAAERRATVERIRENLPTGYIQVDRTVIERILNKVQNKDSANVYQAEDMGTSWSRER